MSSKSLVKRANPSDNTNQLMLPPPPPAKKIKRPSTVLDEDTYTDALSHIIARDYFPGLLETQTRQEVLDALESRDKQWIARAGQRLEEVLATPARGRKGVSMTPQNTVSGGSGGMETPMTTAKKTPVSVSGTPVSVTTTSNKKAVVDVTNLSLNAFQAKYTSEDNESFNKVLDKQNTARREKYAWLWNGNKLLSARQIAHRQREAKRIADSGHAPVTMKKEEGQGKEVVVAVSTDMDARPAAPDTWKAKTPGSCAQNSLMFSPEDPDSSYETRAQRAEAASRAGPKQVVHENTRLPVVVSSSAEGGGPIPPSPSLSAIKDAIAGRIRPTTDSEPGYTGSETPRVNGYAFVDEDDDEDEQQDEEEMYERLRQLASSGMTTTPGGGDSSPNPFNIKQNRKREDLHHRMVDTVAQKKRAERAGLVSSTSTSGGGTPRFPSSPMFVRGNMTPSSSSAKKPLTPAAQKLLQRVGSTPRSSTTRTSSSGLKNMWTPTPRRQK